MVGMLEVPGDFEHVLEALGATGVLRRAGPLPGQAKGMAQWLVLGQDLLHGNLVDPGIPEVVFIAELLLGLQAQPGECDPFALVIHPSPRVRLAEVRAVDVEGMQVVVLPAEGLLDHAMEHSQIKGCGHQHPPLDRRTESEQRHLHLEHVTGCSLGHGGSWQGGSFGGRMHPPKSYVSMTRVL